MCNAEIPNDSVYLEDFDFLPYMTVFALGEAGAKVMDRAAVEWPESTGHVQWWWCRTDHKYRAYSEDCADPDFCAACADPDVCAALADRAWEGVISQERWDDILDRMETLMDWKAHLGNCERHNCNGEYLMILADQKQWFDFLAAASLAKIARGQGYAVIGVITTEEPSSGDALAGKALQKERRLFRGAADCTVCLPRTAEQAPESLLWPAARTLAAALATQTWIGFDFANIKSVFQSGKNAWIGTGSADTTDAATDELLASPAFVKHAPNMSGAFVLVTCPPDTGLDAVDHAVSQILEAMDPETVDPAVFVWTANFEETETARIAVIAAV